MSYFYTYFLLMTLYSSVLSAKPGQCPVPRGPGACYEGCSSDNDCTGALKCCSNGCGHTCQTPVISTLTLVRRPLNTAVRQGSAVTLQCSSNVSSSFIQWYNSTCVTTARSVGDCTDDLIYSGYLLASDVPPRFSVTEKSNFTHVTRDLNINPTQLTDAGVYLCAERRSGIAGVTDSSSAQLIVLGDMRCTMNMSASEAVQEHDVIVMTCSVTYSGNWAPIMRWFNSSHNFTDDDITLTTSDTTVTSQLTITASADLHGSHVVCVTYFAQIAKNLSTTVTNVPSYTDTWTSPTFNIEYAPRNLQITPRQSIYRPGDRILCSAEGNPEPSYQWTDLVSGTVIQGAVLVITEDMMNKSHTFQCTASNQYNSISSTLHFTVEVTVETSTVQLISRTAGTQDSSPSPSSTPRNNSNYVSAAYKSAMIALAVIAGISILINVLLVLYIVTVSRCHRAKDRQSGDSAAAPGITSHSPGDTYQELNMTSRTEPVYNQLERA